MQEEATGTVRAEEEGTRREHATPLVVPPAAFLSDEFVGGAVKRAMRPSGVLAVNVIADSPASIARLKVIHPFRLHPQPGSG